MQNGSQTETMGRQKNAVVVDEIFVVGTDRFALSGHRVRVLAAGAFNAGLKDGVDSETVIGNGNAAIFSDGEVRSESTVNFNAFSVVKGKSVVDAGDAGSIGQGSLAFIGDASLKLREQCVRRTGFRRMNRKR